MLSLTWLNIGFIDYWLLFIYYFECIRLNILTFNEHLSEIFLVSLSK